jgi:hypothetical protein
VGAVRSIALEYGSWFDHDRNRFLADAQYCAK